MASTDVILSSPVTSNGLKSKFLASSAVAAIQLPADVSNSKR
uniref:Uncharacterized protein n=1 Tax=Arundo donax TaxID=35708 RepID=A0A0A9C8I9_ARUDO